MNYRVTTSSFDILIPKLRIGLSKRQLIINLHSCELNTVVCDWESSRPFLCSKLPLFKMSWQTLKVVFCCFLSYVIIDMTCSSNELLFIIIAQKAAKLWPVKVGDPKKNPGLDPCAALEWAARQNSFQTSNFDRSQFCSPLSYDDEKWLIWKPQAMYDSK